MPPSRLLFVVFFRVSHKFEMQIGVHCCKRREGRKEGRERGREGGRKEGSYGASPEEFSVILHLMLKRSQRAD